MRNDRYRVAGNVIVGDLPLGILGPVTHCGSSLSRVLLLFQPQLDRLKLRPQVTDVVGNLGLDLLPLSNQLTVHRQQPSQFLLL